MTSFLQQSSPTRNAAGHLNAPIEYFEDFLAFTISPTGVEASGLNTEQPATIGPENTNSIWECIWSGAGDVDIADRVAKLAVDGGAVQITHGDASGNRTQVSHGTACFPLKNDRQVVVQARFRLDALSIDSGIFIGLCPTGFTFAVGSFQAGSLDDYIGFGLNDSAEFVVGGGADNVSPVSTGVNLVAETWHEATAIWDGKSKMKFYLDTKHVATIDNISLPGDQLVAPTISMKANGNNDGTLDIDYFYVAAERA